MNYNRNDSVIDDTPIVKLPDSYTSESVFDVKKAKHVSNSKSISILLKDKLIELAGQSTSHGIPRILESDNLIIKIMWTVFFLISFIYCMYTIVRSIVIYLQFQTVIQMDIQRVTLTEFPAVTLCNTNPFNTKKETQKYFTTVLETQNLTEAVTISNTSVYANITNISVFYATTTTTTTTIALTATQANSNNQQASTVNSSSTSTSSSTSSSATTTTTTTDSTTTTTTMTTSTTSTTATSISSSGAKRRRRSAYVDPLDSLKQYFDTNSTILVLDEIMDTLKRSIIADKNLTNSDQKSLGVELGDMLLSCTYNKEDCTTESFSYFWDYKHGNCYTFNSKNTFDTPLKTSRQGSGYGLHLELKVADPSQAASFSTTQGIYLVVHNSSTHPMLLADGLYVPTGFETYISVSRTFSSILPHPYSNCINGLTPFSPYSTKLFDYMQGFNLTEYSQTFCYKMCFQDMLIHECKCVDPRLPKIANQSYCLSSSELECMNKLDVKFAKVDLEVFCQSACPVQCDSITYTINNFMSNYPSPYYVELLKIQNNKLDVDSSDFEAYLKKSMLKLIVNYDDLSYTTVQATPAQGIEDIIGSVGGQLGLFIGISLLTFAEIIQSFIEIILILYNYKKVLKVDHIG